MFLFYTGSMQRERERDLTSITPAGRHPVGYVEASISLGAYTSETLSLSVQVLQKLSQHEPQRVSAQAPESKKNTALVHYRRPIPWGSGSTWGRGYLRILE